MDKKTQIFFQQKEFKLYLFVLLCLFVFFTFVLFKQYENTYGHKQIEKMANVDLNKGLSQKELNEKINILNDELHNCRLEKQDCYRNLQQAQNEINGTNNRNIIIRDDVQRKFIDKIYNPLAPPENVYPQGRLNARGYDSYQQYQMIGYLTGSGEQFPVFARDKYPGRTDKQEYYTINDSRNRVKIPFKTKNWNELFDGDTVDIPEIGNGLVFKKYETNELRYDPNVF